MAEEEIDAVAVVIKEPLTSSARNMRHMLTLLLSSGVATEIRRRLIKLVEIRLVNNQYKLSHLFFDRSLSLFSDKI